MKFECPHCGKSFEVKTRKASMSKKANAARKRNAARGGPTPSVSVKILARIYCKATEWKPTGFKEEIEKVTGHSYSLGQACRLLQMLREYQNNMPTDIWQDDKKRDSWFEEREAEGARTHALLLKDNDGVLSNSTTIVMCSQVIDAIKKKRKSGKISAPDATAAILRFKNHSKDAYEWARNYNFQVSSFRSAYDAIQGKLKAEKMEAPDAKRALQKLRSRYIALRDESTRAARTARANIERESREYF